MACSLLSEKTQATSLRPCYKVIDESVDILKEHMFASIDDWFGGLVVVGVEEANILRKNHGLVKYPNCRM